MIGSETFIMKPAIEKMLEDATKEQLTEALLSACQELADQLSGDDMLYEDRYVSAGSLNNQVLVHLQSPSTIIEG
jgi:hypothetical protein